MAFFKYGYMVSDSCLEYMILHYGLYPCSYYQHNGKPTPIVLYRNEQDALTASPFAIACDSIEEHLARFSMTPEYNRLLQWRIEKFRECIIYKVDLTGILENKSDDWEYSSELTEAILVYKHIPKEAISVSDRLPFTICYPFAIAEGEQQ